MRRVVFLCGVLLAFATPLLAAANLTGQWALEPHPDFSGHDDSIACSFVQQREKLTLNCGAGPNITGEVRGRSVTFHFVTGSHHNATATFTGELNADETTITGTWRLPANDQGPVEGKFIAKKQFSNKK